MSNKYWTQLVIEHLVKACNTAWGDPVDMLDPEERQLRGEVAMSISSIIQGVVALEQQQLAEQIKKHYEENTDKRKR